MPEIEFEIIPLSSRSEGLSIGRDGDSVNNSLSCFNSTQELLIGNIPDNNSTEILASGEQSPILSKRENVNGRRCSNPGLDCNRVSWTDLNSTLWLLMFCISQHHLWRRKFRRLSLDDQWTSSE